jgi:hypothetical protein
VTAAGAHAASAAVLGAWLGAAVLTAAVVAPAAFDVLPSRTLAGSLVGRVLPVVFVAGIVAGAVGLAAGRAAMRGAGRGARTVDALLIVGAVSCAIAQFVVGPRIARVRAAIAGPVEALAADAPLRAEFGRLHAWSVGWLGVAVVALFAALALTLRGVAMATSPGTHPSSHP